MTTKENDLENDDVSGLLASMKRVEAPGDFDMRVRARIAGGRPAIRPVWLPMSARVAVPAALVLAVAGYVGLRSYNSSGAQQASLGPIATAEQPASVQPRDPQITQSVPSQNDRSSNEAVVKPEAAEQKPGRTVLTPSRDKSTKENRADGSLEFSLGISKASGPRTVNRESLSNIGIETDPSGAVIEVKQNSSAGRSGLKPGDMIVKVTANNIRVRRDGKVVDIPRKP